METKIVGSPGGNIAVITTHAVVIRTPQDALDLMVTLRHQHNAERIALPKAALCEEFFDLKTRVAGEILQKYTNYQVKLAIMGDFSNIQSKALRDFIYESNQGRQLFFVPNEAAAIAALENV